MSKICKCTEMCNDECNAETEKVCAEKCAKGNDEPMHRHHELPLCNHKV